MDVSLVELDVLRRGAPPEKTDGGSLPRCMSVRTLHAQRVIISVREVISLVQCPGQPCSPAAARQIPRLSVPRGGAARQGVLVAAEMNEPPEEEPDYGAWVA